MSMQTTDKATGRTDDHAPNPRIVNIFKRHSAALTVRPEPVPRNKPTLFENIGPNLLDRLMNTMDSLEHQKA